MSAYDEKVASEEASPMSAEEARWYEEALQAVPEDQRKLFATIPMDVLCVSSHLWQHPVYLTFAAKLVGLACGIQQNAPRKHLHVKYAQVPHNTYCILFFWPSFASKQDQTGRRGHRTVGNHEYARLHPNIMG